MIVDFHSHSYRSDGTLRPQALADFMAERHVEAFSISDHDTLAAYDEFVPPAGSRIVTGIEINTTWRDNEVHLLGYAVPLDDVPLGQLLAFNQEQRRVRVERMVEQLRRAGYSISLRDVEAESDGAVAIGRPHVAKALIRAGISGDIDSAFRDLLRRGRPGYVPQVYTTPATAIAAIAQSGGIPVLAHPGRLRDRSIVDELAAQGLQGLEVFYPLHDADDVAFFRAKAREHGLLMTAGMDFHDIRYHGGGVGIEVADDDIRPFLERAAIA